MKMDEEDDIQEISFDEAVRLDPTTPEMHVLNALNQLHFALHKTKSQNEAIPIVNAINELERRK